MAHTQQSNGVRRYDVNLNWCYFLYSDIIGPMQDVIRHNIIPYGPWDWLSVSRETRTMAIGNLYRVHEAATVSLRPRYWAIIKLLYDHGHAARIAEFTAQNYAEEILNTRLAYLFKVHPIVDESFADDTKIIPYLRFTHVVDKLTQAKILSYVYDYVNTGVAVQIYDLLPVEQIRANPMISDEIDNVLTDDYYYFGVDGDDNTWSQVDTDVVRFAITHFPDQIVSYATRCLTGTIPNGSTMCLGVVIDFATEILDADVIRQLRVRYRRHLIV
ncbi:methyltransferase [Faustovirus]|nr:methyltransferase [Faustovirus]QJX73281.1 methyltransferase [Faustovirus]